MKKSCIFNFEVDNTIEGGCSGNCEGNICPKGGKMSLNAYKPQVDRRREGVKKRQKNNHIFPPENHKAYT